MLLLSGRCSRRRQYQAWRSRLDSGAACVLFRRLVSVIVAVMRLINLVVLLLLLLVLVAIVHRLI